MISLREVSGFSAGTMPAAASSGRVSSKMRPLERAMVMPVTGDFSWQKNNFTAKPQKRPGGRKRKKPGEPGFFDQANRASLFSRADVCSLLALRAGDDVEGHLLVLGQGLETVALNCGEVSEEVFTTFGRGDKTKTLGVVEPLNGTSCHLIAS
jgi:hypothetical protein